MLHSLLGKPAHPRPLWLCPLTPSTFLAAAFHPHERVEQSQELMRNRPRPPREDSRRESLGQRRSRGRGEEEEKNRGGERGEE